MVQHCLKLNKWDIQQGACRARPLSQKQFVPSSSPETGSLVDFARPDWPTPVMELFPGIIIVEDESCIS